MDKTLTTHGIVTAYQYGDAGQFIGEYSFECCDIRQPHYPPHTTPLPPPKKIAKGKEAYFDHKTQKWLIRKLGI